MRTQSVFRLLEKLSNTLETSIDQKIRRFIQRSSRMFFKNLDVYCFTMKTQFDGMPGSDLYDSVYAVRPLPHRQTAFLLSISQMKLFPSGFEALLGIRKKKYSIELIKFNLVRTAGFPISLSARRGEKIIIDPEIGETPEKIKLKGYLRERKKIFEKSYIEVQGNRIARALFWLVSGHYAKRAEYELMVWEIDRLMNTVKWLIENPTINTFKSLPIRK